MGNCWDGTALSQPLTHSSHTFSAFWLWSSVVSVLISVTTDMSPTGDLLVTSIFAGEVFSWACLGAFMCCAGMALSQWQHTLWGNCWIYLCYMNGTLETLAIKPPSTSFPRPLIQMLWLPPPCPSQRSLHSAPIFRLLLKVAVNGTHQCDFHNFWGALCSNWTTSTNTTSTQPGLPIQHTAQMLGRNFPTGFPVLAQLLSLNASLRKGQ